LSGTTSTGSVAHEVVSKSTLPVLVVPDKTG